MRTLKLGSAAILVVLVTACSSGATGSPAASGGPGGQASAPGEQPSVAPAGSVAGGGAATARPSVAPGAGASASQAAGGGGGSTGLAAKPCSLMTEAEVAGILHGAMVATPKSSVDGVTGTCEYSSEESGNQVTVSVAEGAAAKAQFDGYAGAGQLGSKVDGIGDAAYYTEGEISVWKGDHGAGISIAQSDATDEASLKALAVALGKVAAGRL
jgi:hypothetical protein